MIVKTYEKGDLEVRAENATEEFFLRKLSEVGVRTFLGTYSRTGTNEPIYCLSLIPLSKDEVEGNEN